VQNSFLNRFITVSANSQTTPNPIVGCEVKSEMQKTKTIFIIVAVALVAAALVAVTYAQFVNAQAQNSIYSQTPPQGYNGNTGYFAPNYNNGAYGYPCYPYGAQAPNQQQYSRMGMGMMSGRYW
jgi:hypothetical protein